MTVHGGNLLTALVLLLASSTSVQGFSSLSRPVTRARFAVARAAAAENRGEDALDRRAAIGSIATLLTSLSVAAPAIAFDEYLREPTQDFVDSEKRAQEYRKKQVLLKKKFALYIDELNASINDEEMIAALQKMTKLVLEQQDMPSGYTKESFMKIAGLKKKAMLGKGLWGTPVDLAYKTLIQKITLVQSPNRMEAVY